MEGAKNQTHSRLITETAELLALGPQWQDLLSRSLDANTFLSFEWLSSWWTSYQPPAKLLVIAVFADDGRLIGLAPLMTMRVRRLAMNYRGLFFLGDGTYETEHVSFLVDRERKNEVLQTIIQHIQSSSDWDVAHFDGMMAGTASARALLSWLEESKLAHRVSSVECLACRLPESFDTLLAEFPSRARTKLRSTTRQLKEKYQLEFGRHDQAEEMEAALDTFVRLHKSRWSGVGQPGVFELPNKSTFYRELTPRLNERGWLRFYYLKLDGEIVAQQYCFQYADTVYLLQEGFDWSFSKQNIGNVLRRLVFEDLIEKGVGVYDFLAGVSRHKKVWSNEVRYDLRVEAVRPGVRNSVYLHGPPVVQKVKDGIKKVLPKKVLERLRRRAA